MPARPDYIDASFGNVYLDVITVVVVSVAWKRYWEVFAFFVTVVSDWWQSSY